MRKKKRQFGGQKENKRNREIPFLPHLLQSSNDLELSDLKLSFKSL